jgi:hypothetical protein
MLYGILDLKYKYIRILSFYFKFFDLFLKVF